MAMAMGIYATACIKLIAEEVIEDGRLGRCGEEVQSMVASGCELLCWASMRLQIPKTACCFVKTQKNESTLGRARSS